MPVRIYLISLMFIACGPAQTNELCTYAEIVGTCVLVEAVDFDPTNGSPGRIRARYRLIQSHAPELGNHVVLVAALDEDHHQKGLKYFREAKSTRCVVGVRSRGDTCPDLRVVLSLPEPKEELKLSYEARVVAERRARPGQIEPFGEGESTPWP